MEDNKTEKTIVKYMPDGGKLDVMAVEISGRRGLLIPNNASFGKYSGYTCDRCGEEAGAVVLYVGNENPRATTICEKCTESDMTEVLKAIKEAEDKAKTLYVPKHVADKKATNEEGK